MVSHAFIINSFLPCQVYSQAQHTFQQPKQQMTPGPTVPAVHHTAGPPIQLANSITGGVLIISPQDEILKNIITMTWLFSFFLLLDSFY